MAMMQLQLPVTIPTAPTVIAASSSSLAAMTTLRLLNRSAIQPAGEANRMYGRAKMDMT